MKLLVVGGGPAGLSAAAYATQWCESVTLVEARPQGQLRQAGEHLPPAGLAELAALGLADVIGDSRHDRSPGVRSLWGTAAAVDKDYFLAMPSYGLNLRRELFDETLVRRARQRSVNLLFSCRLQQFTWSGGTYDATIQHPGGVRSLQADAVIDATGRRAVAARSLGAQRVRHDELLGLVGRIEGCQVAEIGRVHVEAMEDGWWYGVTLSDNSLLATFMTDALSARRHAGGGVGLWTRRLRQSTLLAPLARGRLPESIDVFDAATQMLEGELPDTFLAVGDAATAYDPLSSWGITKSIRDGHAGVEAIAHGATRQHRRNQRRAFSRYLHKQREVYSAETRWAASSFWRRRQEMKGLA